MSVCGKFAKLKRHEKNEFMFSHRLCFACMQPGHMRSDCPDKCVCHCGGDHSISLHNGFSRPKYNKASPGENNSVHDSTSKAKNVDISSKDANNITNSNDNSKPAANASCAAVSTSYNSGLSTMIVPVYLSDSRNPGREMLVYASLDTFSNTTFVTKSAMSDLNVVGASTELSLATMNGVADQDSCFLYDTLVVRGYSSQKRVAIPRAFSTNDIPLDRSHIPSASVAQAWPHLKELAHEFPVLTSAQ